MQKIHRKFRRIFLYPSAGKLADLFGGLFPTVYHSILRWASCLPPDNVTLLNPVFEVWHEIVLPHGKPKKKALRRNHFSTQMRYIYASMSRFWKKNLLRCNHSFRKLRLPNAMTLPFQKSGIKSVTLSSLISSIMDEWRRTLQRFEGLRSHRDLDLLETCKSL